MPHSWGERGDDPESGVSEIVGAILLISLVVVAVGVIAMVLFSQTGPQQIPNVNFMAGSNYPAMPTYLYLYHNGGDSLRVGDFEVMVDGVSKPYTLEGGGEYWTIGNRLNVDISTMASLPRSVTLAYNSTGGGTFAIHSASVDISTSPGSVKPDIIVTPTPAPQFVSEYMVKEIYTRNYSRIIRPPANTDYSQFFAVELVSSGNSWIAASCRTVTATRTVYPLTNGNKVNVTMRTGTTNFRVSGQNDKISNMAATTVSIGIYNPAINSWYSIFNTATGRNLFDAYIEGCRDAGSTLSISNTSSVVGVPTTLIFNDTQRILGSDGNNIQINRVHPVNPGLFFLNENTASNTITFIGFANDTKVNGIECNNWSCPGLI